MADKGSIEIPTVYGTGMGLIREWLGPASNPSSYLQGSLGWDFLSGTNRRLRMTLWLSTQVQQEEKK